MGIIRRESSEADMEATSQLKEKQISVEMTDTPDEAHAETLHLGTSAPESTTIPLSHSPSISRPTLLPPLEISAALPAERDPRLALSLDSSLSAQANEAETKRTVSMDEMRSVLMVHKQRVIDRLESMGYDPYKGVYVKHRKYLMSEKEKVVHRLEELGLDPVTGSKKHRIDN